jgi:hypothetical protein
VFLHWFVVGVKNGQKKGTDSLVSGGKVLCECVSGGKVLCECMSVGEFGPPYRGPLLPFYKPRGRGHIHERERERDKE